MLKNISIKNIALISELSVDFTDGLNIITGETGAGKSIIIDSINLVLGERAGKELIKSGTQKGGAEATFNVNADVLQALSDAGIDADDDEIVISREISLPKGDSQSLKSVCRINGTMISLAELKSITDMMVDVHGQHEHQSLLSQSKHLEILDSYDKVNIFPLKAECAKLYSEYHKTLQSMHEGYMSEQDREQRIDILTYQLNEIDKISPEVGEDDRLEAEIELLQNGERIMQALYNASTLLTNGEQGALTLSKSACNELIGISSFSDDLRSLADTVSEAYYNLEAASDAVKSAAESFSFDAKRLDEAQDRLSSIIKLKRKYGNSIEAILEFADKARSELSDLQDSEVRREKLKAMADELLKKYAATSDKLSEMRKSAAQRLTENVMENLSDLGLSKAVFDVSIERLEGDIPSRDGIDYVEFMFSANPGEPKKPLRKVASGGEMSRIMLALKNVLAETDSIDTMIFDEIDTGISGNAATVVGMKMSEIARKKQVLAITHLPQIAAFADSHYLVEKTQTDDSTATTLTRLTDEERQREVARIMGGADSALAVSHARELITSAEKMKKRNK